MALATGGRFEGKRERMERSAIEGAVEPRVFFDRLTGSNGIGAVQIERVYDGRDDVRVVALPGGGNPISIKVNGRRLTPEAQIEAIDKLFGGTGSDAPGRLRELRSTVRADGAPATTASTQAAANNPERYNELDQALQRKIGSSLLPPTIDSLAREFGGEFTAKEISKRASAIGVLYPPSGVIRDTVERLDIAYRQGKGIEEAEKETKFKHRIVVAVYHYLDRINGKEIRFPQGQVELSQKLSQMKGKVDRTALFEMFTAAGIVITQTAEDRYTLENPFTGRMFTNFSINKPPMSRTGLRFYVDQLGLPALTERTNDAPGKAGKADAKTDVEAAAPAAQVVAHAPESAAEEPATGQAGAANTANLSILDLAMQAVRDGENAAATYLLSQLRKNLE